MEPGARLGPYEIIAPLGAGGMGEVYRARDTRLGRDVAIKVLPAEFASDPDRLRRFEQEARAVAALDHPNILAIHDVGTHEGAPYLVTELLEGESLRQRLEGGPLPPRKVLGVAIQVASGLAAAHEKGIVHRDLKPENLFVTSDGRVKILDFGIAKLAPRGQADLAARPTVVGGTEPGFVIGTAGYMSPEQVRGLSVDHRSDIFSLGCVLYEMATGRRAFDRGTAADTMAAILTEEPPDPSSLTVSVPSALSRVIAHCLEKRPEDRFSSASDLAFDLQAVLADTAGAKAVAGRAPARARLVVAATVAALVVLAAIGVLFLKLRAAGPKPGAVAVKKVVVLPFENLGAPEDAYFAAGMAEEITSRLANVQGLGVISRTTAVQYDRKGKTIKQIGGDLGVDYVLEGSVRWEHGQGRENRVRITPQLIRVADDTHVWSDRYERVLADVFGIQSEVAESAVKAMGVTLLPRERNALQEVATSDLEAYDLYLRGREFDNRGYARIDLKGALQMYEAAVSRDPRFAQALAGLARDNLMMYWEYHDRTQARVVRAREAAEEAVELRPDLAEAHAALGWYVYQALLDYPRALEEFGTALKLQPSSGDALQGIGAILRRQGRWQEAAETFARAAELDPKHAMGLYDVGPTLALARRYADADRAYARTLALNPQWARVYSERARLQLLWRGDVGRAQGILNDAERIGGLTDEDGMFAVGRWYVALVRRDYQGALSQLAKERRQAFDTQFWYLPVELLRGEVFRLQGRHDLAMRSFEVARLDLEQGVKPSSEDHRLHRSLGVAYAGLGRRDDALREARLACDLMPPSKDALRAQWSLEDLALVYTVLGMSDDAIAALDDLLARSGWWTANSLRLDPRWDPLRSDPRFQALLTKYEVKEGACRPARASARTRFSPRSARAEWARCTAPATRASVATSQSRCCRRNSRRTRSASGGSSARREPRRRSRIPTSWTCTTWGRSRACRISWRSCSRGSRCGSGWIGVTSRHAAPWRLRSTSRTGSRRRTRRGSSTATSSRPTSSSRRTATSRSSISASQSWRRRGVSRRLHRRARWSRRQRRAPDSGPLGTCRRSRCVGSPSIRGATSSRSGACCTRWSREGRRSGRTRQPTPQAQSCMGTRRHWRERAGQSRRRCRRS